MKIVYDNDISYGIAHALRELAGDDHRVVASRDLFPEIWNRQSVPDTKWLARLGAEGDWVAVSADARIVRRRAERDAWLASGVRLFVQPPSIANCPHWDQMVWHVRVFPKIVEHARTLPTSTAFMIPRSGSRFVRIS